ncbi:alpha/beta fold hydrolase [Scleromatobacter humisilvae]|uniref:Alpha/beta fold hydrolase n=1 Tax=Scleromatobacter humisilvae TaxID=2897159 RepID=A0A9X1YGT1_9BURK|nr:alpha/beta fold hydrolase [Scleromatobacter humisilvae]MCK9684433.1 alpha/beta fold hydrolase [Scleromatobacter humisilvae]
MTPDFETLEIRANGLRFHALAAGPADGPLLLLLHGFPETSHCWSRHLVPLAAAGFRVIAPDQRGIGLSSKPEGIAAYRIDHLAADIVALVRALGRERAQVVGHDWGGAVTWYLAEHHADVVERVAIIDVPHGGTFERYLRSHPSQMLKSWYMLFFQLPRLPEALLRANDFRRLAHAIVATSLSGAFTPEDLAIYRQAWAQPGALTGMLNWYRALRLTSKLPRGTGRVAIPVRLMWGDRDHALEPAMAEASIARCDAGEVFHFPDATHWLPREEPERVTALLLEFLRR